MGQDSDLSDLFLKSILLLMEEILHQLIGSLSPYLQGFLHLRWCRISAINSSIIDFDVDLLLDRTV